MKLYIGNIPFSTTEQELRVKFGDFEPLQDLYFPIDTHSGKPRGYAFVTLSSRSLGEQAVEQLNGADLGGRSLRVSEAVERS